jgi:sporulation protein YlmC with PRC-barrel domain
MATPPVNSTYLKREDLLGKSVVSRNAQIVGTVADIAVSLDGKVAIQVQRKSSTDPSELYIGSDEIQAVGDVVLLKTSSDLAGKGAPAQTYAVPPAPSNSFTSSVAPQPFIGGSPGRSCPKCGYLNSANSKFCIKCGTALPQ